MEKASGVYLTLTDNSFITEGSASVSVLVPMLTVKGKIGLNRVTADDYKDIIGDDVFYNDRYLGLRRILENYSYVDVWRLNQETKLANAYFDADFTGDKQSDVDAETFEDITHQYPEPGFAIAGKYTGDWGGLGAKISPRFNTDTYINNNANTTNPQTIEIEDINLNEKETLGDYEILGSLKFYNSTNDVFVGAITIEEEGGSTVYKCHKVVDNLITTEVGSVTFDATNKATIVLTAPFSKDTFWNVHLIPTQITEWNLHVASYNEDDDTYTLLKTYEFSTLSNSEIYWEKVDFGDVQIFIGSAISAPDCPLREYFNLENGSNGLTEIIPSDVDVGVLDKSKHTILLMNGMTEYQLVNRLAPKCESLKIHLFADAPAYASYADLEVWTKKIKQSEYVVIGARPDQTVRSDGKIAYIYPSVSYGEIFARMYGNYGNLNYPPAGPSYGTISVSDLIDCDYEMYKDELKTNRINYQTSTDGTMMWEQRTTYALNSDLSYIAPTFIVDTLSELIVNFERNFNFRYMTPEDINQQSSGLDTILKNYVEAGYLYSYELKVPSYAEAVKAGRTLTIKIAIVVMKDSEVINIELNLTNAA